MSFNKKIKQTDVRGQTIFQHMNYPPYCHHGLYTWDLAPNIG